MDTALYFPHIRVPQTAWFSQILLYWDRAASIVPRGHGLGGYMEELAQADLLDFIDPDQAIWQHREEFDSAFWRLSLQMVAPPDQDRTFTKLHYSKASRQLFDELAGRGVAVRAGDWRRGDDDEWWMVETHVAYAYMSYLASAISGSRQATIPVTDKVQTVGALTGSHETLEQQLAQLRYAAINQALPVPACPIPVRELCQFKERHGEQLRRCRTYLDGKLADLVEIEDGAVRKIKAQAFLQEVSDDVAVLQEAMTKRRWPQILVSVGGVLGAVLAAAGSVATGGSPLIIGLALGAGVLQVGAAGHAANELARLPRYDKRSPLAYAARVGKL